MLCFNILKFQEFMQQIYNFARVFNKDLTMKTESKVYKRYTVTSALPYANGPLHIGHLAGVYVPADIFVRYLRSKGEEVIFIGGSDEHGVPITIKAKQEGTSPQEIVDKYHELNKKSFEEFGISFDVYSRTSAPVHHSTASDFFKTLYEKDVFIEKITNNISMKHTAVSCRPVYHRYLSALWL